MHPSSSTKGRSVNSPTFHPNTCSDVTSDSQPTVEDIPSVDWWVTSRCNLHCDFCYGPTPSVDPVQLRDRIATAISLSPGRAVTFCGGEPLLVRKLADYARRQQMAGKATILNTNGELLRRRFDSPERLPFDVVGISIDGPNARVHRQMRGADADFDETLAAARWIADHGQEVKRKIGTVLSAVNVNHVEELAGLVRALAPDVWRIYQYSPWGPQNRGQARHQITESDFNQAVRRAAAAAFPVAVNASTSATTGGCLIVDPYGSILRTEGDGYVAIGNCLDEPVEHIWRRSPQQSMVRTNKLWLQGL
jgi:MoaA/NifB/PqqE/SkfB family radical SAM enzyme